jgi:hypothetical protein
MTNFPWVISQGKKATTPFDARNYLIIDEVSGNTVPTQISIFLSNLTSAAPSDAKLTHKINVKALIGLLGLAGALQSNKQSLEELWGTDGD